MPLMCKACGKRPASVHFTEIVNHNMVSMDLCAECAEARGVDVKSAGSYGLGDLAAGFINSMARTESEKIGNVRCPQCGYDYSEFKKIGRLGCPDCYRAFEVQLLALLRQVHGSTQHKGGTPQQLGPKALLRQELMELKNKLARAVEKEEYEEAAGIRDRIKELEAQVEGS